jgi:hypothetical protein
MIFKKIYFNFLLITDNKVVVSFVLYLTFFRISNLLLLQAELKQFLMLSLASTFPSYLRLLSSLLS